MMNRGDLVHVALPGDYGKPRPAVAIQSDIFSELPSVTVLPLTSDLRAVPQLRITVEPDASNGLKARSQVMVDKANTLSRKKVGTAIGKLAPGDLAAVNRALLVFLGLTSAQMSHSNAGASHETR
jgi:mRNA interferase MazF